MFDRSSQLRQFPSRRAFLNGLTVSFAGIGMSPWLSALAGRAEQGLNAKTKHCVLLWMTGGPSQTDTFDMKPGHSNGGPFKEIQTSAAGLRFSEHLPRLAKQAEHLAVLRGLTTQEGDHGRGTYLMRTGRVPQPAIRYPSLGAFISKEIGDEESTLPAFVSVNPYREFDPTAFGAGFLGPRFAPLEVKPNTGTASGFVELGVDHLLPPAGIAPDQTRSRLGLLDQLQASNLQKHPQGATLSHHASLQRALKFMSSDAGDVFDLSRESPEVRQKYGAGTFGQGCLLARRLIERGVAFIEVSLGDFGRWDTHNDNFNTVQQLSAELDAGWASLMEDLAERGLLESTTILWMGEFGRTPVINSAAGRDHFPNAWSAVLAGGGINGGQAYGKTSADGMTVEDGMMNEGDLIATLCAALNLDPRKQNLSDIGRPFRLAEGKPVESVTQASPNG